MKVWMNSKFRVKKFEKREIFNFHGKSKILRFKKSFKKF
jgi:hypothetical protein